MSTRAAERPIRSETGPDISPPHNPPIGPIAFHGGMINHWYSHILITIGWQEMRTLCVHVYRLQ